MHMHDGSVNEDHFANIQWGSLLQINNQKYARNVKRSIKTSDMVLLLIELVASFAIAILDALNDCEFPLPTRNSNYASFSYETAIHDSMLNKSRFIHCGS